MQFKIYKILETCMLPATTTVTQVQAAACTCTLAFSEALLTSSWDLALMVSGSKSSSADCITSAGPPAVGVSGTSVELSADETSPVDPLALLSELLLTAVGLVCLERGVGAGWAWVRGAALASKLMVRLAPKADALQQAHVQVTL